VDPEAIRRIYAAQLERILAEDPRKRVLPGVEALLEYTSGRKGWRNMLLTSNFKVGAEIKLRALGLWEYFADETEGVFGDFRGEKWDAAAETLAAISARDETALSPEEVFIRGDGLYDISCARRLGCGHIAVATGWTPRETLEAEDPEFLLDDLSDTGWIIDILERAAKKAVR
jgi:phosphoglycolate phosphatase-like HAD superfamily hydrolase